VHGAIDLFESRIIGDGVPDHVRGVAGNAKQRRLNAPGLDNAFGHEFVADRLPDRFHEIQELRFFARIDGVFVPES